MRRLLAITAAVAILILAFAPAAMAAGPVSWTGSGTIISTNGTVDIPAGQALDGVVVVNGSATIEGAVNAVVLVHSTATFTGATAHRLVVVDSTANLGPGTTVTGDIAVLHGTVTRDPSASVLGHTTSLDVNLAALAFALIPLIIVLWVGFFVAVVFAGLALAAFGARQTRTAEDLITHRPGHTLVSGLVATIALPVFFGVLTATIIGAPIGLAMLLVGLPLLAFIGWLVAAIWLGDWMLGRTRGADQTEHPYKAAILGVVVLAVAGLLPLVSAIATLFGVGAVVLAAWNNVRPSSPAGAHASPPPPPGWTEPVQTTAG